MPARGVAGKAVALGKQVPHPSAAAHNVGVADVVHAAVAAGRIAAGMAAAAARPSGTKDQRP